MVVLEPVVVRAEVDHAGRQHARALGEGPRVQHGQEGRLGWWRLRMAVTGGFGCRLIGGYGYRLVSGYGFRLISG